MRLQQQTAAETESAARRSEAATTTPPAASWPDAVAFREAIQDPASVLTDPELADADVVCDRRGLPLAYSGRFAVVFRLRTPTGGDWALRYFTQPGSGGERAERYAALAEHVAATRAAHLVPFRFLGRGARVGGSFFPVVALRWADGETLGRFIDRNLYDGRALRTLCAALGAMLHDLEASDIAHGDWQHDNLLVSDGGRTLTLVDYDSVFVPSLAGRGSPEIGHANYQHPARIGGDFAVGLDRFACVALQTALLALARDPSLWDRFNDGESVLFKRADFLAPDASPAFRAVRALANNDATLAALLDTLEASCRSGRDGVFLPDVPVVELDPSDAAATADKSAPDLAKWWLAGEVAEKAASQDTKGQTEAVGAFGSVFGRFLDRLNSQETLRLERANLRNARVTIPLGLTLLVVGPLIVISKWSHGGVVFWFWFSLMRGLISAPVTKWPRRLIREELVAEIDKLEKLLKDRRVQAESAARLANVAGGGEAGFIRAAFKRVAINDFLKIPGVSSASLRCLRAAWVNTALDLKGRVSVPGVPPAEMARLHAWYRDLETTFTDEFRRRSAGADAEFTRLQSEITALWQEVEALRRELDAFPDTSLRTYLRKLCWLPEG